MGPVLGLFEALGSPMPVDSCTGKVTESYLRASYGGTLKPIKAKRPDPWRAHRLVFSGPRFGLVRHKEYESEPALQRPILLLVLLKSPFNLRSEPLNPNPQTF